jgi:hypothetical protein
MLSVPLFTAEALLRNHGENGHASALHMYCSPYLGLAPASV